LAASRRRHQCALDRARLRRTTCAKSSGDSRNSFDQSSTIGECAGDDGRQSVAADECVSGTSTRADGSRVSGDA
jgi:hypothetical protein